MFGAENNRTKNLNFWRLYQKAEVMLVCPSVNISSGGQIAERGRMVKNINGHFLSGPVVLKPSIRSA